MTSQQFSIALTVASYVVGFPVVRRLQRNAALDNDSSGREGMNSWDATLLWAASPIMLVGLLGYWLFWTVPPLLFPKPRVQQVKERLNGTKEQQ